MHRRAFLTNLLCTAAGLYVPKRLIFDMGANSFKELEGIRIDAWGYRAPLQNIKKWISVPYSLKELSEQYDYWCWSSKQQLNETIETFEIKKPDENLAEADSSPIIHGALLPGLRTL